MEFRVTDTDWEAGGIVPCTRMDAVPVDTYKSRTTVTCRSTF